MKIFLDMDGVLADFDTGFQQVTDLKPPDPWPKGVRETYLVYGVDEQWMWDQICKAGFYFGLPETPEFHEIMEAVEPYDWYILSNPGESLFAWSEKAEWLDAHGISPKKLILTKHKEFLAGTHNLLVDDYETNINSFRDAGGCVHLWGQPWNNGNEANRISRLKEHMFAIKKAEEYASR